MHRRRFLSHTAAGVLLASGVRAASGSPLRAAIIGHTGHGNFGHNLDLIFNDRPGIEIVGLADPDAKGRAAARERTHAQRAYVDYREMLEKEHPDLVCVSPRWTNERHEMLKAALGIGAHVYCEKPFAATLTNADEILALAARSGRKIAVAHQGRLAPNLLLLKQQLDAGLIGDLLEIRVHGKQDKRAGGEDLIVLGTHQFDLVRLFAGDPLWCNARILQSGREVTLADAHPATEGIGPIVGDEIEATFAFPRGVNVHYTSRAQNAKTAGPWGMELIGSKGRARLLNDVFIDAFIWRGSEVSAKGQSGGWVPLEGATPGTTEERSFPASNRRVVDDWLAAIRENREPVCSGHAGMKALEMIHAIFAAGIARTRVALPLKDRRHPLVL